MSDEMSDVRLLDEFKGDEIKKYLVSSVLNELINEENKGPFNSHLARHIFNPIPEEEVRAKIVTATSFILDWKYSGLRGIDEKDHCESLIEAQNYFVDFAYNAIIMGVVIKKDDMETDYAEKGCIKKGYVDDDDIERGCRALQLAAKYLNDSFIGVRGFLGRDKNDYIRFLGKVAHGALSEVHPSCKGLYESFLDINKKYSL